jgi:hypothetical protein
MGTAPAGRGFWPYVAPGPVEFWPCAAPGRKILAPSRTGPLEVARCRTGSGRRGPGSHRAATSPGRDQPGVPGGNGVTAGPGRPRAAGHRERPGTFPFPAAPFPAASRLQAPGRCSPQAGDLAAGIVWVVHGMACGPASRGRLPGGGTWRRLPGGSLGPPGPRFDPVAHRATSSAPVSRWTRIPRVGPPRCRNWRAACGSSAGRAAGAQPGLPPPRVFSPPARAPSQCTQPH